MTRAPHLARAGDQIKIRRGILRDHVPPPTAPQTARDIYTDYIRAFPRNVPQLPSTGTTQKIDEVTLTYGWG